MATDFLPSEVLKDNDDIWGQDDEITTREWSKMDQDFTNAGYREGITAGKESALQEGFDDGFDNVGAPLGREVGILRGIASAVMSLVSSAESRSTRRPKDPEKWKEVLRVIIRELGRIHLADLAPRDIQAEEHAREHLGSDATGEIHVAVGQDVSGAHPVEYQLQSSNGEPLTPKPAVEELRRIREQLADVLKEIGLEVPLQ